MRLDHRVELFLDAAFLNVLVGDADGHAKNLSLLHGTDGQSQVSRWERGAVTLRRPQDPTTAATVRHACTETAGRA